MNHLSHFACTHWWDGDNLCATFVLLQFAGKVKSLVMHIKRKIVREADLAQTVEHLPAHKYVEEISLAAMLEVQKSRTGVS